MRLPIQRADEATILRFNPWEGDQDSDAVTLRDVFVTTRKPSRCALCFGDIQKDSRVRAQTQRSAEQRKVMTFKFCDECCRAMVVCVDWPDVIEARYGLGMHRAEMERNV